MAVCLVAAGATVRIAAAMFTLAWSHTVEHQPWQEDWRVVGDRLMLVESRVKGSGAGMEPPPDARLANGWYVWRPQDQTRDELILRRAADHDGSVGDWLFCAAGRSCAPLGALLGTDADPVLLRACG